MTSKITKSACGKYKIDATGSIIANGQLVELIPELGGSENSRGTIISMSRDNARIHWHDNNTVRLAGMDWINAVIQ